MPVRQATAIASDGRHETTDSVPLTQVQLGVERVIADLGDDNFVEGGVGAAQ